MSCKKQKRTEESHVQDDNNTIEAQELLPPNLRSQLILGEPWRASAPVLGELKFLADRLRGPLHKMFPTLLKEECDGIEKPIRRNIATHVELLNPQHVTKYPEPLQEDEIATRDLLKAMVQQCRAKKLSWHTGSGTGMNTTASLVVDLTGRTHACRGVHITIVQARAMKISEIDKGTILATANHLLKQAE